MQEQQLNELDKNSDKKRSDGAESDGGAGSPPAHLHDLLASLQKHLLAHLHVNSSDEYTVRVSLLISVTDRVRP